MAGYELIGVLSRGLTDLLVRLVVGGATTLAALLLIGVLGCLGCMLLGELRGGTRRR